MYFKIRSEYKSLMQSQQMTNITTNDDKISKDRWNDVGKEFEEWYQRNPSNKESNRKWISR